MSELKTLEEMKGPEFYRYDTTGEKTTRELDCNVSYNKLKQEAIKWYHRSDGNKHKFIKHFFNLTKEDLENE